MIALLEKIEKTDLQTNLEIASEELRINLRNQYSTDFVKRYIEVKVNEFIDELVFASAKNPRHIDEEMAIFYDLEEYLDC